MSATGKVALPEPRLASRRSLPRMEREPPYFAPTLFTGEGRPGRVRLHYSIVVALLHC
jgi:hypothetical protein